MILNICLFTILSFQIVSNVWFFWVLLAISWIPTTLAKSAASPSPFPNPTFQAFSKFILATFSSDISLTTTLLIDDKNRTTEFALKLDKMTCFLHLTPYKSSFFFKKKSKIYSAVLGRSPHA